MSPLDRCARTAKGRSAQRPRFDLGEIFRAHSETFRAHNILNREQDRVLRAICACRTAALGGHLDVCLDCGNQRPAYNSCRNRHCPKCQALDQHRWLEQRLERILPVGYFHIVFTLPSQLAALGLRNQRLIYGTLFKAASSTLLTLGKDPKRLGALIGATMVLHTWTKDLRFHPHIHAIVTGGGLSLDDASWRSANDKYLFPVKVIGKLFRGKFLHHLAQARDQLVLPPELAEAGAFDQLLSHLYDTDWVVYAKRPFAGAEQVFSYLGRYTHRVALSNHRILDVNDNAILIATRGGNTVTLSPQQLIRRFLLHVLPRRFVKIRHYGLMASANVNSRLQIALALLSSSPIPDERPSNQIDTPEPTDALFERLTGIDLAVCPRCSGSRIARFPLGATRCARPPPKAEVA